ncbi:MBL fold metallo-hydrolase [Halolamina sp.]|jgi:glyoxylase-like metal-dependent hydrolase (beta-lactamase superfamily II)|uniref:MBL fold metallo-hydrolase n=1 Tax=Halolamina sp. TaxID=1940283 RepID=UPI000223BDF2|nr:beta-lactamase domain protein [halophilic archaeon DL31]
MHVDAFSVPVETRAPDGSTNAYVVGSSDCLLVDPAARTSTLDTVVAARDVTAIAVTHTHPDHVGAVAEYAAETGAALLAHRPDRFAAATGVEPDRQISEGTVIQTGVGPVTVLETPGHAVDHVAFELPDRGDANRTGASDGGDADRTGASDGGDANRTGASDGGDADRTGASDGKENLGGTVICGDLAVAEGSVVVGAPEGDLRAYLTSLRRLWARNPRRLYPGHGPAIGQGVEAVGEPRAVLKRLLTHRLDREAMVLAAVRAGATTVDAVVDAAYEKDLSGVRDLALATVRAHLEKLAVEGTVRFDPETGAVSLAYPRS